ncbi:MAG: hypothetical protein J3K34DRAFT_127929 [Monoraphidium minutum]|nr:MAG: hypothetical protein J3K34DRAFT_127929 [Monoraphidium minutum]
MPARPRAASRAKRSSFVQCFAREALAARARVLRAPSARALPPLLPPPHDGPAESNHNPLRGLPPPPPARPGQRPAAARPRAVDLKGGTRAHCIMTTARHWRQRSRRRSIKHNTRLARPAARRASRAGGGGLSSLLLPARGMFRRPLPPRAARGAEARGGRRPPPPPLAPRPFARPRWR